MAELFLINPVRKKRGRKRNRNHAPTKKNTMKTHSRRKRRSSRRSSSSRSLIARPQAEFGKAISHDNLKLAGGALAASFLTTFIFSKFGAQLPLNKYPIVYKIGIPVLGAVLLRSYNSRIADGMIFGATLMGSQEALKLVLPAQAPNGVVLNENPDFAGYGEDELLDAYAGDPLVGETLDAIEDSSLDAAEDEFSYAADPFADNQSFTSQTWA